MRYELRPDPDSPIVLGEPLRYAVYDHFEQRYHRTGLIGRTHAQSLTNRLNAADPDPSRRVGPDYLAAYGTQENPQ